MHGQSEGLKADPRTPTEELHKSAGVPMLSDLRAQHACNVVYRGVNGLLSDGVNKLYNTVTTTHNVDTRNSAGRVLKVPRVNLNVSKGNTGHHGAVYYNIIPAEIRSASTATSFKSRLRSILSTGKVTLKQCNSIHNLVYLILAQPQYSHMRQCTATIQT